MLQYVADLLIKGYNTDNNISDYELSSGRNKK